MLPLTARDPKEGLGLGLPPNRRTFSLVPRSCFYCIRTLFFSSHIFSDLVPEKPLLVKYDHNHAFSWPDWRGQSVRAGWERELPNTGIPGNPATCALATARTRGALALQIARQIRTIRSLQTLGSLIAMNAHNSSLNNLLFIILSPAQFVTICMGC